MSDTPKNPRCDVELYGSVYRAFCVTHNRWFGAENIPPVCILATWNPDERAALASGRALPGGGEPTP